MSLGSIVRELSSLSEDDLVTLNTALIHELKHKRSEKSRAARNLFQKGDAVGFGNRGARGKKAYKEGVVHRIKRTRAEIQVGNTLWTVPLNMLQAV
jgi:hypothetical protein